MSAVPPGGAGTTGPSAPAEEIDSVPVSEDGDPMRGALPQGTSLRWSRYLDLVDGSLPEPRTSMDAEGPDRYPDALRRYVEVLGAEDAFNRSHNRTIQRQEQALTDHQSEALAELLNALVARHRLAQDVFADPDPASPLRPGDMADLVAAQKLAVDRAQSAVRVLLEAGGPAGLEPPEASSPRLGSRDPPAETGPSGPLFPAPASEDVSTEPAPGVIRPQSHPENETCNEDGTEVGDVCANPSERIACLDDPWGLYPDWEYCVYQQGERVCMQDTDRQGRRGYCVYRNGTAICEEDVHRNRSRCRQIEGTIQRNETTICMDYICVSPNERGICDEGLIWRTYCLRVSDGVLDDDGVKQVCIEDSSSEVCPQRASEEDRSADRCSGSDGWGGSDGWVYQYCHDDPWNAASDCPDASARRTKGPGQFEAESTCPGGTRLEMCGIVVIDIRRSDDHNCFAPFVFDLAGDDGHVAAGGASSFNGFRHEDCLYWRPDYRLRSTVAAFTIDVLGDDTYGAGYPDSVVWDRSCGNYLAATGSGVFGVGGLVDVHGDDLYESNPGGWNPPGDPWDAAAGSAIYGAGLVLELAGDDNYTGRARAYGGSVFQSGVAQLVDVAGHDVHGGMAYRVANGAAARTFDFDAVWGDLGFLATGVASLVDLAGDDQYHPFLRTEPTISEGNWYTREHAANGAVAPVVDPEWDGQGNMTFNPGLEAYLVDATGDDRYDGNDVAYIRGWEVGYRQHCGEFPSNGAYGLLWDGGGTDVYCDAAHDRSQVPKPGPGSMPSSSHLLPGDPRIGGAQIDREPTDTETTARKLLVSPPRSASEPGCNPGRDVGVLSTKDRCGDPYALAEAGVRCATNATTGIDDEVDGEPLCPTASEPVGSTTRDGPTEGSPLVDRGRVLWERDGTLHATDPYTQTIRPLVHADEIVDTDVQGHHVYWVDEDGWIMQADQRTGNVTDVPSPVESGNLTSTVQYFTDSRIPTEIEVNPRYFVVEAAYPDGHGSSYVCLFDRWLHRLLFEGGYGCMEARDPGLSGSRAVYIQEGDVVVDDLTHSTFHYPPGSPNSGSALVPTEASEVAIDGSLVAWITKDGRVQAWDARWNDTERRIEVGDTGGLTDGLAITESFVVWRKSWDHANWTEHAPEDPGPGDPGPARRTVLVGCDVSVSRDTGEPSRCDDGETKEHFAECRWGPYPGLCAVGDEAYCWLERQVMPSFKEFPGCEAEAEAEPVPGPAGRYRPVLISDPLAADNVSSPSADGSLIAWEAGEDVRYAHMLGPKAADLTEGMQRCLTAKGPEIQEIRRSELGQPDLDSDGFGDCWMGHYAQVLGQVLDVAGDLDCDTLNNLAEFRWQTHPIYDTPPYYSYNHCGPDAVPDVPDGSPQEIVFDRGRDLDMDYLIDGYEARYIARAHGEDAVLRVDDVADTGYGNAHGLALYHPLKDQDSDGDGVRDLEDRNSDSQVTEDNPVTDTIQDGIEVWLLGTFPDEGDSDCDVGAHVCYGARNMTVRDPDQANASASRGAGDEFRDHKELYFWTVDVGFDTIVKPNPHERSPDAIDNVLLDPDVDNDGMLDYRECVKARENAIQEGDPFRAPEACEPEFEPPVGPILPDTHPGAPHTGGLEDWNVTELIHSLREAEGSDGGALTSSSGTDPGVICPNPWMSDTDGDSLADGEDPAPCEGLMEASR